MNKSMKNLSPSDDLSTLTTYQAGVLQAAAHRTLQKYCDEILKKYEITKMHWLIIGTVLDAGDGGIRTTDLARKLDTTISYLTTTINLLVSKDMLVRVENEQDSRSKYVSVHPDFVPRCEKIEETLRAGLRKSIYMKLTPNELKQYMKVLYKLSGV